MRLLAMDTSGPRLSAAVHDGTRCLSFAASGEGEKHSSALIPAIERALEQAGLGMGKIDAVAVCLGPGSFTGLRVGVTAAKMLGYVLKKRLIGVSSLEAMAASSGAQGRIASMLDARRSQVYAAVFEKKGERLRVLKRPALMSTEAFERISWGCVVMRADASVPDASSVAMAALACPSSKGEDPFSIEPLYLRPRDCNVTLPKNVHGR